MGCVPPACQLCMFQWPPLDVSTGGVVGHRVSKFEQVFSDDHQMSVAGGGRVGPMSGVQGGVE